MNDQLGSYRGSSRQGQREAGEAEQGGQEILNQGKPPRGRRELEMASEGKLGGQRIQDGLQS